MKEETTAFQEACRAVAESLVASRGLALDLAWHEDGYLVGVAQPLRDVVELHIYEDEVGWSEGRLWWICEVPDYPTSEEMLVGFREKFSATLDRLVESVGRG